MKKKLTITGALIGVLWGVGAMVVAYAKGPGHPGFSELIVQAIMIAVLAAPLALFGFLVGWFIDRIAARKKA